jgi:hypothetical protein
LAEQAVVGLLKFPIRVHDRLLILSWHSMNSEWVKTEIANVRRKEQRETRQVLFPIRFSPFGKIREWECFDADTAKDSAREIREVWSFPRDD